MILTMCLKAILAISQYTRNQELPEIGSYQKLSYSGKEIFSITQELPEAGEYQELPDVNIPIQYISGTAWNWIKALSGTA